MRGADAVGAVGRKVWDELVAGIDEEHERFDPDTLEGLPEAAQRFLHRAVPAHEPLRRIAVLEMTGVIRIGGTWQRFGAREVVRAGVGFVWTPRIGRGDEQLTGADLIAPSQVALEYRHWGLVPDTATGPASAERDVARSAAARLALDTAAFIPQALTPQLGARWTALDRDRASVRVDAAGHAVDVEVIVDRDGTVEVLAVQRWGDPDGTWGTHTYGGPVEEEHVSERGVTVAGSGRMGWWWNTPRWEAGDALHYTVTEITHPA